ncbi:MAG: hypothetical protein ACI9W4_001151 [Rhodothermales bacterium]|jgi:hypothetical protein
MTEEPQPQSVHTEIDDDHHHDHQHDGELAIPTLAKVAIMIGLALVAIWVGWLLR